MALVIELDEEIQSHIDGTDVVFNSLGGPVPLTPPPSAFDLSDPPRDPIAISFPDHLLFVANSQGFMVAETPEVIRMSKEIKEKGKGPSVLDSCLLDVKIGKVSILALSVDSLWLAAVVGSDVRFYSVDCLRKKESNFSLMCSIKSGVVKDFKWQKNTEKAFLILSSHGSLHLGHLQAPLKDVMDNVDAVDWSETGAFIAVAKKNTLSILSRDLKEQCELKLLFQSWSDDTDSECSIKVDSINWLRNDSIVIGCVRVFEDGKEESYLVQVIAFRELEFTEGSSKPVVFSFPDLFTEISDDILPTGYGPYLRVSYLKHFGFTLASIKKAIGSHILVVCWGLEDDLKEAVSLEYETDRYPRIELQENGDDNLILGFVVDQTPSNEKVGVKIGSQTIEVVPNCTLWCLTSEGKLILYHIMRISDPSDSPETISSPNDYKGVDEKTSAAVTVKDQLPATTSRLKDGVDGELPLKESEPPQNLEKFSNADDNILTGKNIEGTTISSAQLYVGQRLNAEKLPVVSSHMQDPRSLLESNARLGIQESCFTGQTLSTASPIGSLSSEAFTTKQVDTRVLEKKVEKELVGSTSDQGALFGSQSTGKLVFADNSNAKSSSILDGSVPGNIYGSAKIGSENKLPSYQHGPISDEILPGGKPFNFKVSSSPPPPSMVSENKTIQSEGAATFMGKTRNSEPFPAMHKPLPFPLQGSMPGKPLNSMVQPSLDNSRNHRSTWMVEPGTELPKQFYNVKNMAKELDNLLSFIEREGGFRDACTVFQESSLLALKDGLQNLSVISQVHKKKIEEQLLEIQQVQNKMLQVSTRQVYVEGLVKQASNDQYWDIWKRQKLSPELELKRQHIFDTYQGMTNQLIGLERHFNTLEISKFGENGGVHTGRRALHANVDPLRRAQSFQKVYNTLNSQLAAAEQLSNCLSEQMAMLNINPLSVRHPTVVKELFESIGLSQEASIFHSPESIKRTSASASTAKGNSKINTSSTLKVLESGTMRRRYSLDKSLSKFEPPKTIVKRMLKESDFIVVADKHVRTSREAFHSQTAGYAINLQKSNDTHASSFSNPSMPMFHSVAYPTSKGTQGKPCKEAFELMPSFKWTMEHSGSTHNMQSDSHLDQPTSSSSPSAFFSNLHGIADGNFQLADSSSNVATHSVSQSASSTVFKTAPYSKEMANVLSNSFPPTQTSVTFSGSSTPNMKTTLLCQKVEDQKSGQFSQKPGKDGPTKVSARSSDHLGVSEKGLISVSDESTHSLQSGVRSVDGNRIAQVDVLKSQSEPSETSATLSHSVASELTPLFSTKQSSTSLTSSHSSTSILPFFSSSSSISSASISSTYIPASSTLLFCEQSSFDTKPVKETQSTTPVPSSTSAPSTPSLFPSSKPFAVQSHKSLVPTSSAIPFDSAVSQSPSLQRNVANSSSESTQLQASEAEGLLQTKEASPLSKPVISQASTVKVSVGLTEGEPSVIPIASVSTFPPTSQPPEVQSATISPLSTIPLEKDEGIDLGSSQEDEMEEEAPNMANAFNLGALGGFGLGSTSPILQKPNPFGGSFSTPPISSPFSLTTSPGELFRPASLSIPPAKPIELSQPTQSGATSGGFGGGFSGFGQPANIGSGQQALGSVLGAFGQSRQLGVGVQGMGFASSGGFGSGGFSGASNSGGGFNAAGAGGGFSGAATGGGFAGAAIGGGFAAAGGFSGANIGGGFAAVASKGGGFAAVASGSSGGFGGANPGGGGFTAGGFGAFNSNQGAGFSGFRGNNAAGTGGPPAQLFTQMRK